MDKIINNVQITNVKTDYIEPSEGDDSVSIVLGEQEEKSEETSDEEKTKDTEKTNGPKTGDETATYISAILILSLLMMLCMAVYRRQ